MHQIELGLERVYAVAARAGLQHLPGKKVLIAGTNGKGTTACCIEQLLLAQGKTVKILTVGKKGREQLKRDLAAHFVGHVDLSDVKRVTGFFFVRTA